MIGMGALTPFGVAESTYAISDIGEGVLDLVSSATGKHVCTRNWNFVRDNVCGGNENTYNVVKSVTALGSIAVSGFQVAKSLAGLFKSGENLGALEGAFEGAGEALGEDIGAAERAAGESLKPLEESIEATEIAAGEAIEESAAAGSAASTAKNATQASEKLVKVYRGTDICLENSIYDETGHLMSDATRILYRENGGNLGKAYADSVNIHSRWLEKFTSENEFVQAHSRCGSELSSTYGLRRTFMSVTTDMNMAKSFAGTKGRVYEALVPESSLIRQTLPGSGESEYLIKFGSEEFKWIQE